MIAGTEQVSSWDSGAHLALGSQGIPALLRVSCTQHLVVIYSVSSPSNDLMLKVATQGYNVSSSLSGSYHSLAVHDKRGICLLQISKVVGAEAVLLLPSAWAPELSLRVEQYRSGRKGLGTIRKVLGTVCYIFLVLESPATVTVWAHGSPKEHLGHWVITFLWSDSTQQLDTPLILQHQA